MSNNITPSTHYGSNLYGVEYEKHTRAELLQMLISDHGKGRYQARNNGSGGHGQIHSSFKHNIQGVNKRKSSVQLKDSASYFRKQYGRGR